MFGHNVILKLMFEAEGQADAECSQQWVLKR